MIFREAELPWLPLMSVPSIFQAGFLDVKKLLQMWVTNFLNPKLVHFFQQSSITLSAVLPKAPSVRAAKLLQHQNKGSFAAIHCQQSAVTTAFHIDQHGLIILLSFLVSSYSLLLCKTVSTVGQGLFCSGLVQGIIQWGHDPWVGLQGGRRVFWLGY